MPLLNTVWREFRYAVRSLAKRRGNSLLILATLAIGIGVSTATFSVVDAILLKPLPYRDAKNLVMVWTVNAAEKVTLETRRTGGGSFSPAEIVDWRERSGVFEQMVAVQSWFGETVEHEQPFTLFGYAVSEGFFPAIGVEPMLGRAFLPEEEKDGGPLAMVLQYDIWMSRFRGDPNVVGTTVNLGGRRSYRIVGVMPPGFVFFNRQVDAIVTLQMNSNLLSRPRRFRGMRAVARLKPGLDLTQAQSKADVYAASLEQEYPEFSKGWKVILIPVSEDAAAGMQTSMMILLGAVGCLLAIMCANVTNLMMIQAAGRAKDWALRTVLGAGRWSIIRQLLMESLTLSVTGGLLGLGIAWGMVLYFRHLIPDRFTWGKYLVQAELVQVDPRVVAFSLGAAILVGILVGLLPALHVTRDSLVQELKDVDRGSAGGRRSVSIRNVFVVAQFALAVVLVVGSGLLVRSFLAVHSRGVGFGETNVLTAELYMPSHDLNEQTRDLPPEQRRNIWRDANRTFTQRMRADLAELPGVKGVTTAGLQPMSGFFGAGPVVAEGTAPDQETDFTRATFNTVARDYFDLLKIPILRGRGFDGSEANAKGARVVLSQSAADQLWPGQDPVGRRLRWRDSTAPDPWMTVVGVCGDIREAGAHLPPQPYVYGSFDQNPSSGWYFIHADGDPYILLPQISQIARKVHPKASVYRFRTIRDLVIDSTWQLNYSALILGGLAWLSLFLALIGVYGVMSHSVRERTREIGVRMAFGARSESILTMVTGSALRLAGIGLGIGLLLTVGLIRVLQSLIFEVDRFDGLTFGVVSLVLVSTAVLAGLLPARRAARVDPMVALRQE